MPGKLASYEIETDSSSHMSFMFSFSSMVPPIPSSRQAHKQQAVTDDEVLHSYPSAHSSQKKIFCMR
jgi:DNA polymerase III alpha subunit (gram-positive type)